MLKQIFCQVSGLVVDCFEDRAQKWVPTFIPHLSKCLMECLKEWRTQQESNDIEEELIQWELGYFALKTIAKITLFFRKATI
jgi:hypothetical protein